MNRAAWVAVVGDDLGERVGAALGARVVRLFDETALEELDAIAAGSTVLWVPLGTRLDSYLTQAIARWREALPPHPGPATSVPAPAPAPARVAIVRPHLVTAGTEMPLPRAVVLSSPGGARWRRGEAKACTGAARETLATAWPIFPPDTLSEHLAQVNWQTSVAARLCHAAGERPTVAELAFKPMRLFLRAALLSRGDRRLAWPRAAIEAYRHTLVMAKLWELGNADARPSIAA